MHADLSESILTVLNTIVIWYRWCSTKTKQTSISIYIAKLLFVLYLPNLKTNFNISSERSKFNTHYLNWYNFPKISLVAHSSSKTRVTLGATPRDLTTDTLRILQIILLYLRIIPRSCTWKAIRVAEPRFD